MPDYVVIEELQDYLVAQGIGQRPSVAPSLTVPSIWLAPRDGAPDLRSVAGVLAENVTVTLIDTMFRSPNGLEPWLEESFVDVIVRSRHAGAGKLVQRRIRDLIEPGNTSLGGKKNWMMGDLRVEYSRMWRGDQPLPQRQATSESDPHVTYDRVASYMFGCRRKVLAGLSIP